MAGAFRGRVEYQWLVGVQFLGHPYVGKYTVDLTADESPITRGMPRSYTYNSKCCMAIDQAIDIHLHTL